MGIFGSLYVVSALINAATSTYNSAQAREQQEQLAERNRELTKSMEANRQDFQLELSERNAEIQRELSLQNHELRILEQKVNFEKMCLQAEWTKFLNVWPLINMPSVIRAEQVLSDNTVSLRVIFAKSNDTVFSKFVYPKVEQGLKDFVDIYHNVLGSKNIIFYQNAFVSNLSGGAVDENIHYALKELPVIIINTNVLLDEICVSFTMWGLGGGEKSHFTVFRLLYQQKTKNGNIDHTYYTDLTEKILAYLKFVLGYAYDAYNLIQYNRAPLLLKAAAYELEQGATGCLLGEAEVMLAIEEKYGDIYTSVIGVGKQDGKQSYAALPESCKQSILHELRMEYAESLKDRISETTYMRYLDEAVEAWAALRTTKPTVDFLTELSEEEETTQHSVLQIYFGTEDVTFFNRVAEDYKKCNGYGKYSELVVKISDRLRKYVSQAAQNNLGDCYYNEQNYEEAVKWYRKAAEQGHVAAQKSLGVCYQFGKGVEQSDKEAVKWYRKAAEQGLAAAQNNLASMRSIVF